MTYRLLALADQALFWSVVLLDVLLAASAIFIFLYALWAVARLLCPSRLAAVRHPVIPLVLFLTGIPAVFTPVGAAMVDAMHCVLIRLVDNDPAYAPYFPIAPVALWLAVAVALAARQVIGLLLLRRGVAAVPVRDSAFDEACATLGMPPGYAGLTFADAAPGPCSWGVRRRQVFVPRDFIACYSPEERCSIYVHELLHLRRRDSLKLSLIMLARALFWFHPAVRHALSVAVDDIEITCDLETIRQPGIDPRKYAHLLLTTEERAVGLTPSFFGGGNGTKRRLGHIIADATLQRSGWRGTAVLAWTLAALLLLVVATLTTDPQRQTYPADSVVRLMPDGHRYRIVTVPIWDGALGSYCIASCEKTG